LKLDDIERLSLAEETLEESEILFRNKKYKRAISMFHSAKTLLLVKDINPKKHAIL